MKKKLTHNLGLKLLSLVFAFLLWFVVVQIDNPKDTKTFNNIKVKLINTDVLVRENKVYEVVNDTDIITKVTVKAPRSIIEQLRATDIVAYADVNKLSDINTIAIAYDVPSVDAIEGSQEFVKLNVEEKESRWVKITAETLGDVADGFVILHDGKTTSENMVEVTGPKSAVDKVGGAKVQIDVAGATSNLSAIVEVKLYDREGKLLEQNNLKKSVNTVTMSVEVLEQKEVPIEIRTHGEPAEGFMKNGNVTVSATSVKIAGKPSSVSALSKIVISGEDMDISGATANVTLHPNLRNYLPENVKIADVDFSSRMNVEIGISPKAEKRLDVPIANIAILNIPEDYTAEIISSSPYYTLKMEGLSEKVNPIRSTEVKAAIDIEAWMKKNRITELQSGVYKIPIVYDLDNYVTVLEPEEIDVTILKKEEDL